MAEKERVRVEVVKILGGGACPEGLRVGDAFVMGVEAPAGFCSWALTAIHPFAAVVRFGGTLPWEREPGVAHACCPDPDNPVVFRISRVTE